MDLSLNHHFSRRRTITVLTLGLACTLGAAANAQDAANVHGLVTDSSGAVVVGTTITATSLEGQTTRTATTNASGLYGIPQLPPGHYRFLAQRAGFQDIVRNDVDLTTGQNANIDFSFQVGAASQSVDVNANAEMLDVAGSSLSTVIEGRQVEDMPLNGRNVLNLVTLVPGVVPQGSSQGSPVGNQNGGSFSQPGGYGNYQIGGGFAGQSVIYIDGAPNNMLLQNNYVGLDPTQDAIQEFRVETNNVSARFGGFNGGVINMTTRSGTNTIHGTAYEFLRNRVLNANNFFNNRNGVSRPTFTQNQYGLNVGAPIRKDKTFAFFSWENFAVRQGLPLSLTVPTVLMRGGNFSEQPNPIYDPCGGTVSVGGQGCPNYTGPATPFYQNTIPMSRFDPTAVAFLNLFPLPNLPGYVNNYAVNSTVAGNSVQFNGRADQNLTANQRLFVRYSYWHVTNPPNDPFKNGTGDPEQNNHTHQALLGYTYAITPKTVFETRISWLYLAYYITDQEGINEGQFGPAYAALSQQEEFHVLPILSITGNYTNGFIFGGRNFQEHHFEDSNAFASLTHIIGRHTLEAGGEFRTGKRFPALNVFNGSGQFNFNNNFTAANPLAPGLTGYGLASFLLGYTASGNLGENQPVDHLLTAQGYYLQDNWQATRKLSVNMGIRWDSPGAIKERNNLDTVLLPNIADPLGGFTNPVTGNQQQATGQLVLVDSPQYPSRYERNQDHHLFSPHFGFDFAATPSTVLRGGFGIAYARTIGTDVGPRQSPINAATTNMISTNNGGRTPANTLSNPFPNTTLATPVGRNAAALYALDEGQSITGEVPTQPWAYTEQWNLQLEQQLSHNSVLTIGYAAAAGVHLARNGGNNLDQLPDQYDSMGATLNNTAPNPFYGRIPASAGTLGAQNVLIGQLLRPFPQYLGVNVTQTMGGQSIYHALQTSLTQRLGRNGGAGTFLLSYTWAKLIDNVDDLSSSYLDPLNGAAQDYTNLHADRSESSYNAPHRLIASYVADLPFGRGKRFLNSEGTVAEHFISGWQVNGIDTFQQGFPLPLTAQGNALSSFGSGAIRPNFVPGPNCVNKGIGGAEQAKLTKWFNTSCFSQPGSFSFGNEPRVDSQIRISGIANWDAAIMKTTPIAGERLKMQFDTEFFNLFNRVQFGDPGNNFGSGNFGVVAGQSNQPRLIQFALRLLY